MAFCSSGDLGKSLQQRQHTERSRGTGEALTASPTWFLNSLVNSRISINVSAFCLGCFPALSTS